MYLKLQSPTTCIIICNDFTTKAAPNWFACNRPRALARGGGRKIDVGARSAPIFEIDVDYIEKMLVEISNLVSQTQTGNVIPMNVDSVQIVYIFNVAFRFFCFKRGRSHWSRVGLRIIVIVHNHRSILLIMNFSLSEFCHCYIICRQSLTSLGINDINSVFASFENIRLCHDHFGALIIRLFVIGLTGNPASPGLSGVILGGGLLLSSYS